MLLPNMKDKSKEDLARFYNQRSDKYSLVFNDNELHLFKSATHIVKEFHLCNDLTIVYIACIMHDRDFDDETHQLKTKHYHIVLQLGQICRVGTILNRICDMFHCNENQISIEKCNSLCMQSRYLMHLDDFDKTEYFLSEVVTNDAEVLKRYYSLVIVRDLHDLISVVKRFNYDLETIMENVAHYDKWRKYINDLIINYNRKPRL